MNYLKHVTDFFLNKNVPTPQIFADSLIQDLLKTKADFEKDGLLLDIEPVEVTEQKKETEQYYVHQYTGTYIYGFQKNGIFHQIPGDMSTKTERHQNESGTITFYINKHTNKVDTISETFAGNSWGEKQKKKKKFRFFEILGILFAVLIVGTNIYNNLKPKFISLTAENALHEYIDDISACVSTAKEKLGDKKVAGLEYDCAIHVASTFYHSDSEKAIQLCMIHNPFFDIQLEREYSKNNTDDLYARQDEQLARTSCQSSIERKLAQNPLCNSKPTQTDNGRSVYPIDPIYKDLTFLGQLFTAHSCGPERLSELHGIEGETYTLGSSLRLKHNPSQSLIDTLTSIGYACSDTAPNEQCTQWELWKSIQVDELLQLKPFYEDVASDDCTQCG